MSPFSRDANDNPVASYAYDCQGRRISRTIYGSPDITIKYAYEGAQIIAEYDANDTLLRKFIYGPGVDEPIGLIDAADGNAVYYYHLDGLGSVVALSNVNSVLVERYAYDVFGRPTIRDPNGTEIDESAYANPYLFTGRAWDGETALYYYRARYYDYYTGRFLQPDPIGYSGGLNLYGYVGNNPGGFVDPWGLYKEESRLERVGSSIIGYGTGLGETVSDSVDGLIYTALHPWTGSYLYIIIHQREIAERQRAAIRKFWADVTSGDAERIGHAMGSIGGFALTTVAMAEITSGIGKACLPRSAGPAGKVTKGAPKHSPKFQAPTNPAQLPPKNVPAGMRLFRGRPTQQYPNGYWKIEQWDGQGWQRLDPRTMKPGSHPDAHVPMPDGYKGPFDN